MDNLYDRTTVIDALVRLAHAAGGPREPGAAAQWTAQRLAVSGEVANRVLSWKAALLRADGAVVEARGASLAGALDALLVAMATSASREALPC